MFSKAPNALWAVIRRNKLSNKISCDVKQPYTRMVVRSYKNFGHKVEVDPPWLMVYGAFICLPFIMLPVRWEILKNRVLQLFLIPPVPESYRIVDED